MFGRKEERKVYLLYWAVLIAYLGGKKEGREKEGRKEGRKGEGRKDDSRKRTKIK